MLKFREHGDWIITQMLGTRRDKNKNWHSSNLHYIIFVDRSLAETKHKIKEACKQELNRQSEFEEDTVFKTIKHYIAYS